MSRSTPSTATSSSPSTLSAFVDFTIAFALFGMVRNGWRRGLVFYVVDLVGFAVAVVVAVRYHHVLLDFLAVIGFPPFAARIAAGVTIFLPIIVFVGYWGGRLSQLVRIPGVWMTNRVAGAAFAGLLGAAMLVTTVIAARTVDVPLVADVMEDSIAARAALTVTGPLISAVDAWFDLGLCEGTVGERVPEVCNGS